MTDTINGLEQLRTKLVEPDDLTESRLDELVATAERCSPDDTSWDLLHAVPELVAEVRRLRRARADSRLAIVDLLADVGALHRKLYQLAAGDDVPDLLRAWRDAVIATDSARGEIALCRALVAEDDAYRVLRKTVAARP